MLHKLRIYFRKQMPGMTRMKAVEMRNKLSIAYNFMAFNLFVVTVYYALKDSFPKGNNLPHYKKILSVPNDPRVVTFDNFTKVQDTVVSEIEIQTQAEENKSV